MTKKTSLSNSLRGKIWLATTALAFLICIFGVISYLVASFLVNNTFYAVFIPFLLLSGMVALFGWWISNEVINPIEKVLLLTKSLERGNSTSVPKTSGASETDDLMESVHRLSQQTQKLLISMEEVAQGKVDVTITPNSNSDRITSSFQRLLNKVSESIYAKQDLERMESAISHLAEDIAPIKQDNLNFTINSHDPFTQDISDAFNYLLEQLNDLVLQVKNASAKAQTSSLEIQKRIDAVIEKDDNRVQKLNEASVRLKQVPQIVQKISEELSQSVYSASHSIAKARQGSEAAHSNLTAVAQLRKQIHESIKHIQKLSESSQELKKVAKTVEDLAQRTSMVALNASIQASEINEQGRGFVIVSEEVERLAERANNTNKTISSLNKSIQTEIDKVESSLETTVSEISNLSKFGLETGNVIGELERYITQFLSLQEKIVAYTHAQTDDTEQAFQVFVESISETEKTVVNLKESAKTAQIITERMANLQNSVSHFTTSFSSEENRTSENPSPQFQLMDSNFSAQ